MKKKASFLLINPYITDFAAYNLWLRPRGLMRLHHFLKSCGHHVDYVDALFPSASESEEYGLSWPEGRRFHTGKFPEEIIEKPKPYKTIPRYYRRFGVPEELLLKRLTSLRVPDCVLMTSGMTYWYPGIQETIGIVKKLFKDIPVILGGVYATLCPEHARELSGADAVAAGWWEESLPPAVENAVGIRMEPSKDSVAQEPESTLELYPDTRFATVRLTNGCPFNCDYCASRRLSGTFRRCSYEQLHSVIRNFSDYDIEDIAFYDDALLAQAERSLLPLLQKIEDDGGINCRFHTPNGLHARYMTPETARMLWRCRFKTVRLSYDLFRNPGEGAAAKVAPRHLAEAASALVEAGYSAEDIEVYSLMGLHGQGEQEVMDTVSFIKKLGLKVKMAQYSPTPGTRMFERDCRLVSGLRAEPLLHNSSAAPMWDFKPERYDRIKRFAEL